jgi:hypothetical protein
MTFLQGTATTCARSTTIQPSFPDFTMTLTVPSPEALSSEADRWIVVGSSTNPEAELAVREALAPVMERANPRLTIIFCSPAHNLAEISRLVQAMVGSGEVIGCSTAGELLRNHPMTGGLLIWALGGEGFAVTTGVGLGDPATGLRDAAQTAAQCLRRLERKEHTLLFLLADGLCGDQMEVVRGAYDVSGAGVPLMGGCAGDDMALQATQQIHSGEILTHAVVAAAITPMPPWRSASPTAGSH